MLRASERRAPRNLFELSHAHAISTILLFGLCGSAAGNELKPPDKFRKTETKAALEAIASQREDLRPGITEILNNNLQIDTGGRQARGRRENGTPRIVNGAGTIDFPSTGALLKGIDAASAKSWCTGLLIGCDKFLTAAHCVADAPAPAQYRVYFQHAGLFGVKSIDWQKSEFDFPKADVAVLTLDRPVERIEPARISQNNRPIDGTPAIIVGFGRTGGDAFDYGIKREGFITTNSCPEDLRALPLVCWKFNALIANTNLQSNTCNSDSGGPLFIGDSVGGTVINVTAGVTSGGKKDTCLTGDQSYDADVQFYHRWIEKSAKYDPAAKSCGIGRAIDLSQDTVGDSDRLNDTTQELSYNLSIASTTRRLIVSMNGEENDQLRNDFDLYLYKGPVISTSQPICVRNGSSQFASCQIEKPASGVWTAVVKRKSGNGLFQIIVTQLP
jgi:hypothetical protein